MKKTTANPGQELLDALAIELFQVERSACAHPRIEADRLGVDIPPGRAMRAIADDAEQTRAELLDVAAREGITHQDGKGEVLGESLSKFRDFFLDRLVTREKTYRGTLLGLRHAIDVVELARSVAETQGKRELAAWCTRWMERRRPLIEAASRELAWFAQHPDRAREPAKESRLGGWAHSVLKTAHPRGA